MVIFLILLFQPFTHTCFCFLFNCFLKRWYHLWFFHCKNSAQTTAFIVNHLKKNTFIKYNYINMICILLKILYLYFTCCYSCADRSLLLTKYLLTLFGFVSCPGIQSWWQRMVAVYFHLHSLSRTSPNLLQCFQSMDNDTTCRYFLSLLLCCFSVLFKLETRVSSMW